VNMGPVFNSASRLSEHPDISTDGLSLYFVSARAGGYGGRDVWVTTRETTEDNWGEPVNLGSTVNSTGGDSASSISSDGLLLLYTRPGDGSARDDIWVTRRASVSDPWGLPVNVGPPVNTAVEDLQPNVSADGRTLYFSSNRGGGYGGYDVWQAPIIPIVDFNADGKVDGKEVLMMAEHWGQNYPLCDIGPFAWGDGVVDANDLTVLARYIGQEVNDPTLIACWKLDEASGVVAADSAGHNNLTVMGNATWQPSGGKIGGALAFDGKGSFAASAKSVLDPAAGPFSVIAWVKGGAANRVIVSQESGADWLYLNQYGMLTTDLAVSPRAAAKSLTSDAYVPDDRWHRVVLTWDGTNRVLGVDGVEVAKDTQPSLAPSNGNLNIGGGKNLTPATFWSGLIDDVRIYDRAVKP
jgi:hypothetical protein